MKYLSCILILFCLFLTGCIQSEDPTATPTVIVTKRVIIDTTPSPSSTENIPILTPKVSNTANLEFDVFAIERNLNGTVIGINLDGNSVDFIKSISIVQITYKDTALNFIPLTNDEILALENKYLGSIYYAAIVDTSYNGIYTVKINVILSNGQTKSTVLYGNVEL